jgi:hypothetical protein
MAMNLFLPRRWAAVPLLAGALYLTLDQGIILGGYNLFSIRLLILVGIVRVIVRGERPANINTLDWLMIIWLIWALVSGYFHANPKGNIGIFFNVGGIYLLFRIFCQSVDDALWLCRIIIILLVPVAVEMVQEQFTLHNMFSILGGVSETPVIREGRVRSQGPFAHAILAGTVGAVCLPLAVGLWQKYRKTATIGILACLTIAFTSASSGPLMSCIVAIGGLLMWRNRYHMRLFRWLALLSYLALDLVMKAPAYYLIARIDLSGGSTGWHRADLINSGLSHLGEWWLVGTDYTRHWMPTGVSWSPDHADITNHYLQYGIIGGLPLMLLFILILAKSYSYVGQILQNPININVENQFFIWCLGVSLFAHTATMISVSYFDQSIVFLYFILAIIGSISITISRQETHAKKVK